MRGALIRAIAMLPADQLVLFDVYGGDHFLSQYEDPDKLVSKILKDVCVYCGRPHLSMLAC